MEVKLTKIIEAEDCTHEFLSKEKKVVNHSYAIVKYEDGTYAIVHKSEVIQEFKEKSKIYNNTWLLTLLDDTQCIMYYDKDKIKTSKPFLRLIYVFERFVLIENLEGKRKLLDRDVLSKERSWLYGLTDEYKIMQLPNGKKTILKKQGLEVLDFEFDDYIFSRQLTNVVIVRVNNRDCLVRISDFRTSLRYLDISPYNTSRKPINIVDYVIYVSNSDERKALLRVKDFEISDKYDDIKPINHEYALVTINGKEDILRLSDFRLAKFD